MVVSAMTLVGGTKLLVWMAALLLTNLLTAVIFTVTNQTYQSGIEAPAIYSLIRSLVDSVYTMYGWV